MAVFASALVRKLTRFMPLDAFELDALVQVNDRGPGMGEGAFAARLSRIPQQDLGELLETHHFLVALPADGLEAFLEGVQFLALLRGQLLLGAEFALQNRDTQVLPMICRRGFR